MVFRREKSLVWYIRWNFLWLMLMALRSMPSCCFFRRCLIFVFLLIITWYLTYRQLDTTVLHLVVRYDLIFNHVSFGCFEIVLISMQLIHTKCKLILWKSWVYQRLIIIGILKWEMIIQMRDFSFFVMIIMDERSFAIFHRFILNPFFGCLPLLIFCWLRRCILVAVTVIHFYSIC